MMSKKASQFGGMIRKARLARQVKQIELARYLGVVKSQLYRYETGETLPKVLTLWEICARLNLDFNQYSRLWIEARLEMEENGQWQTSG